MHFHELEQYRHVYCLFKGQIRCKMDLENVLYDNELERSFWRTKKADRRILQLAVFSRYYQNAINLER